VIVSDDDIQALIAETKALPQDYLLRLQPRPKRGHRERELELTGANGRSFRLILRQSMENVLDFSVILTWLPPQSSQLFRLCRYNGKSHEHSNTLESQKFYGFYIHRATERYQRAGGREDAFAEPTDRYEDLAGALQCMIQDCGFRLPANHQPGLFDLVGEP
jgi:hypothetical protein